MATALAAGRHTEGKSPSGEKFTPANLEEVAERLQAVRDYECQKAGKPERRLDRRTLESRERMYRALCRRVFATREHRFRTAHLQLAAAAGFELTGDREKDERRCTSQVRRALADLEAANLIQWSGIKWPNGQWRCIEVCMPDSPPELRLQVDITTIIVRWVERCR